MKLLKLQKSGFVDFERLRKEPFGDNWRITFHLVHWGHIVIGVRPPPFLLVCIDVLCNHSVGLNAFGCSISSPDMSQSNCCQVNCFTSN